MHAELVFGLAGGDLLVCPGVDIRIDAQRHRRCLSRRHGARRQQFELRLGFDIEAVNAGGECKIHLARRLADAGKDYFFGRDAGCERPAQFTFRNHVRAGTELGQRAQHGLVGIRLRRVADQRVEFGEGFGEDPEMARQRRRRVAVERSADACRDRGYRHVLGMQDAVTVFEMVHGKLVRKATGSACRE